MSKLNTPDFQSFQVDLIPSGIGVVAPQKVTPSKPIKPSKNKSSQPGKALGPDKPSSPSKKSSPTQAPPVEAKSTPTNTPPPFVRPKIPKEKAPIAIQDDPDRLEEWWKKQSKAMKTTTKKSPEKRSKVVTPKRRTAKIDIIRRPIVVPKTKRLAKKSKALKKNTTPPALSETRKGDKKVLETPLPLKAPGKGEEFSSPGAGEESSSTEAPTETASLGSMDLNERLRSIGGASTGSIPFAFPGYLQRIDNKIRWQWAPPPVTPDEDNLVVRFDIRKNGSIDKMSVVVSESSGNLFFDQAALRAIYAAHPFPPLPFAYTDQTLTVYMHFIVQEAS